MVDDQSGTVVFVFMDIAGSTGLLERLGDQQHAEIVRKVQQILSGAVSAHSGRVVESVADEMFAVFSSVRNAMETSVDAQQSLIRQAWPDGVEVRVRIGVHAGELQTSSDGYKGGDVYRAATICASAHGGQILISQVVHDLLSERLPAAVRLKSLGEFRLSGFLRPQRLFQVLAPSLPERFPAPRTTTKTSPFPTDRAISVVMFTDMVGSTAAMTEVGDRNWREVLDRHHEVVRDQLTVFQGQEIDTAGDGFFVRFDGASQGIHCAVAINRIMRTVGLGVRFGLHVGEVNVSGEKISGLAVAVAARIAALAGPSEILVSAAMRDITLGSGLRFVSRSLHSLKGVPHDWELFALDQSSVPLFGIGEEEESEVRSTRR